MVAARRGSIRGTASAYGDWQVAQDEIEGTVPRLLTFPLAVAQQGQPERLASPRDSGQLQLCRAALHWGHDLRTQRGHLAVLDPLGFRQNAFFVDKKVHL